MHTSLQIHDTAVKSFPCSIVVHLHFWNTLRYLLFNNPGLIRLDVNNFGHSPCNKIVC